MSGIITNINKIKNYYFIVLPNGNTVCYGNEKLIKKINEEMIGLELKGKRLLSYLPDKLKWDIFWDLSHRYRLNESAYWIHFNGIRYIHLIPKIKGGVKIFEVIGNGMWTIGSVFESLVNGIITLLKGIVWLFQLVAWFFSDFLDINLLMTDFFGGIVRLTRIIIIGFTDVFFGIIRYIVNTLFGPMLGNIWGWDQDTYNKEGNQENNSSNNKTKGGLVENTCGSNERKCFRTKEGNIPFTVIIATIFMPPLGVFMEFGLSYWINIIICIMLTMFYYLPGLIYALLLIFN
tara:strand:- start:796 stop:1665 length:870 start_codon:yes stop_codon:yes gene_type:complete